MIAKDDDQVEEPCEALAWDSSFWGFPVARVAGSTLTPERLHRIDQWCQARSVSCLYFLATFDDPTTVRCAEVGGFRLVDARITAAITPERFAAAVGATQPEGADIRPATAADLDALRGIASKSYRTTRFYFDQHFPHDKCEKLYEQWVTSSFHGFADAMIVAAETSVPVGYTTCHLPKGNEPARIGLIDVAPHARKRGIGQALIGASLDWFAARGVRQAIGVTQARNTAIQAFNDRCGFVTQSFQLWYHKWYRLPEQDAL